MPTGEYMPQIMLSTCSGRKENNMNSVQNGRVDD